MATHFQKSQINSLCHWTHTSEPVSATDHITIPSTLTELWYMWYTLGLNEQPNTLKVLKWALEKKFVPFNNSMIFDMNTVGFSGVFLLVLKQKTAKLKFQSIQSSPRSLEKKSA